MIPKVLVATWRDGVFVIDAERREHELSGCQVQGVTTDGRGGVLAIVDGRILRSRDGEGEWTTLSTADGDLSCCVASNGHLYVGTDDARILRLTESAELVALHGFESIDGRETWFAGQALVDGRLLGPPLGVRSLSATADGALLANVHVGGIPRSIDGGTSWHPTIAIESDVHEVRAHPTRPNIVAAAAAMGLCMSSDGGKTWSIQQDGLHAPYCASVAFVDNEVLVCASEGHFASKGRIYRRPIDADVSLSAVVGGAPEWTEGIVDTHCLSVSGLHVAFADKAGNVYVSLDSGRSWSCWADDLRSPSSVHIL